MSSGEVTDVIIFVSYSFVSNDIFDLKNHILQVTPCKLNYIRHNSQFPSVVIMRTPTLIILKIGHSSPPVCWHRSLHIQVSSLSASVRQLLSVTAPP